MKTAAGVLALVVGLGLALPTPAKAASSQRFRAQVQLTNGKSRTYLVRKARWRNGYVWRRAGMMGWLFTQRFVPAGRAGHGKFKGLHVSLVAGEGGAPFLHTAEKEVRLVVRRPRSSWEGEKLNPEWTTDTVWLDVLATSDGELKGTAGKNMFTGGQNLSVRQPLVGVPHGERGDTPTLTVEPGAQKTLKIDYDRIHNEIGAQIKVTNLAEAAHAEKPAPPAQAAP